MKQEFFIWIIRGTPQISTILTPTRVGAKTKTSQNQNLNIFVIEQKLKDGSSFFTPIPKLHFIPIQAKKNYGLRFSTKSDYRGSRVLTGISVASPNHKRRLCKY